MKIIVSGNDQNIHLRLPTNLILSPAIAWIADRACGAVKNEKLAQVPSYAAEALANLPPDAVARLFAELRRIKRKHGTWDLVEVESADGEHVLVQL